MPVRRCEHTHTHTHIHTHTHTHRCEREYSLKQWRVESIKINFIGSLLINLKQHRLLLLRAGVSSHTQEESLFVYNITCDKYMVRTIMMLRDRHSNKIWMSYPWKEDIKLSMCKARLLEVSSNLLKSLTLCLVYCTWEGKRHRELSPLGPWSSYNSTILWAELFCGTPGMGSCTLPFELQMVVHAFSCCHRRAPQCGHGPLPPIS